MIAVIELASRQQLTIAKSLTLVKLGVGCTFASRLGIEGDEPVETVEEIRQVLRAAPKQGQFVRVSLIGSRQRPQPESDAKRRLRIAGYMSQLGVKRAYRYLIGKDRIPRHSRHSIANAAYC